MSVSVKQEDERHEKVSCDPAVLAMALSLAACGGDSGTTTDDAEGGDGASSGTP